MQHFRHHVRLRRKSGIYCLQLHQKEIIGMKLNLHDFKFNFQKPMWFYLLTTNNSLMGKV